MATLFLMVGLAASGKTTRARVLAGRYRALRLTLGDSMILLFPEPEADGKRDMPEGRLIWLGLGALRLGTSVVLDFGFWARDRRSALRSLTPSAGGVVRGGRPPGGARDPARVDLAAPGRRAAQTLWMSEADVDRWRGMFEVPDAPELGGGEPPEPLRTGRRGRWTGGRPFWTVERARTGAGGRLPSRSDGVHP